MNKSELIVHYGSILKSIGLTVDEDSKVSFIHGSSDPVPVEVNKKPLALPTDTNLKKANELAIFHPYRENLIGGQSPTLIKFNYLAGININIAVASIIQNLLTLVLSTATHNKLDTNQRKILIGMPDIKPALAEKFTKISKNAIKTGKIEATYVKFHLARKPQINKESYIGGAIVTFPFYELLKKESNKIYDVNVTDQDKEALKRILEVIFPGIENADSYSKGVSNTLCPLFSSLLLSIIEVKSAINSICEFYGDFVDNTLTAELDWGNVTLEIEKYKNVILMIPNQDVLEMPTPQNQNTQQIDPSLINPTTQYIPPQPVMQNTSQYMQHPNFVNNNPSNQNNGGPRTLQQIHAERGVMSGYPMMNGMMPQVQMPSMGFYPQPGMIGGPPIQQGFYPGQQVPGGVYNPVMNRGAFAPQPFMNNGMVYPGQQVPMANNGGFYPGQQIPMPNNGGVMVQPFPFR